MKYIIYTLTIVFLLHWNLNAQNCCVPKILHDEYERDVKHLALLRMELFNSPELNFIDIDQTWQDTIWKGLAAIYYSESEGRNAVFNQYCIHHLIWTTPDYLRIPSSLYVKLDPNASWYQNWAAGDITTNVGFIDSLLQKYGFDTVTHTIGVFKIITDQYLNLKPLADSLSTSSSIIFAEPPTVAGGSMRIVYQKDNGQSYFTFMLGWDDCPSGCLSWYSWSFMVDNFCNAFYLGASGSPGIPDPTNCNIFVDPSPEIIIDGDLEICQGESTTLTASGGVHYDWNTGDSTASIVVSPSSMTPYSVTVTGNDGCSYEKSVSVIVHPLPTVALELFKDTFCINETNIELTGGAPVGGSFNGDGVSGNYFEPANAGVGTHLITYTFQDNFGCINFDSQEITVIDEDCITDTKNITTESVKIIPNPTNGNFEIISKNLTGPSDIQLYNSRGRSIYSDRIEATQVNIKDLPEGIYLLKVSNEKFVAIGRIIVQY